MRWFDRKFALGLPDWHLPHVIERIAGTPARTEELISSIPSELYTRQIDSQWSIQENVGHLIDLESLWLGRVEDFLAGQPVLREADLANTKTDEADHNSRSMNALLSEFRAERYRLMEAVLALSHEQRIRTSLHPRLQQPMQVVDLIFFVAEHDDHHLAIIRRISAERE